jgi:hypothetical protein
MPLEPFSICHVICIIRTIGGGKVLKFKSRFLIVEIHQYRPDFTILVKWSPSSGHLIPTYDLIIHEVNIYKGISPHILGNLIEFRNPFWLRFTGIPASRQSHHAHKKESQAL